jgi:hypothetical protein
MALQNPEVLAGDPEKVKHQAESICYRCRRLRDAASSPKIKIPDSPKTKVLMRRNHCARPKCMFNLQRVTTLSPDPFGDGGKMSIDTRSICTFIPKRIDDGSMIVSKRNSRLVLAALALTSWSGLAIAQVLPSDPMPTCAVTPAEFDGWFTTGHAAPNGLVEPADNLNFVPHVSGGPTSISPASTGGEQANDHCDFYKRSEQMFLWVTSPTHNGGRVFDGVTSPTQNSGRVFESAEFYNAAAPRKTGMVCGLLRQLRPASWRSVSSVPSQSKQRVKPAITTS